MINVYGRSDGGQKLAWEMIQMRLNDQKKKVAVLCLQKENLFVFDCCHIELKRYVSKNFQILFEI